ncbi:acyltransferase [Burkholderia multivorans]|uniref:acyltransferase family protein n=1 Tax=Burkholderia multivorans TaxID=87883 RepID=UPI001C22858C|nr:acyltransferase [Burkholderia multivorans]MBU9282531.1 acyltransferase [Burkholderia multivorans]MCL4660923.1 acyltransferase [Burkholderia multivorans]MCO1413799.1 acyltransferase [Burkholderia multivorans]MCO1446011.1 acyltransferase [Burkholderia multivorans]
MPLAGLIRLVFPSITITVALCVLATIIARRSDFYRCRLDEEVAGHRFRSIDGLRGLLAIVVLYHHAVISYFFYATGHWDVPPSRLATLYGQGGVAMFFMVTALLFWTRALEADGGLNLRRFFGSRVRRLVPMYLVSAGALIITALALTHFRLNGSPMQIVKDVCAWLLFTFPGTPDINGLPNTGLINTVYWTLVYEWKFYLLFPLMTLFTGRRSAWALLILSAILISWYSTNQIEWYFVYGALAATLLVHYPNVAKLLRGKGGAVLVVALLAIILRSVSTAYDAGAAPLFFGVFFVVACGNTMFGLLTSRPVRLLGMVSYSIYLSHNFVLYLTFKAINHFNDVSALTVPAFWGVTAAASVLIVILSALTYRYIEYPFLKGSISKQRSCVEVDQSIHA